MPAGLRLAVRAGGGAGVERPAGDAVLALGHHRRDVGDLLVGRQVGVDRVRRPAELLGAAPRTRTRCPAGPAAPRPGSSTRPSSRPPLDPVVVAPTGGDGQRGHQRCGRRGQLHHARIRAARVPAICGAQPRSRRTPSPTAAIRITPLTVPCQNDDTSREREPVLDDAEEQDADQRAEHAALAPGVGRAADQHRGDHGQQQRRVGLRGGAGEAPDLHDRGEPGREPGDARSVTRTTRPTSMPLRRAASGFEPTANSERPKPV